MIGECLCIVTIISCVSLQYALGYDMALSSIHVMVLSLTEVLSISICVFANARSLRELNMSVPNLDESRWATGNMFLAVLPVVMITSYYNLLGRMSAILHEPCDA